MRDTVVRTNEVSVDLLDRGMERIANDDILSFVYVL